MAKAAAVLLVLIAAGVPVAAALGWLALGLQHFQSPLPLYRALGDIFWQTGTDFLLVAIPIFILMGELLLRAGVTGRMYDGLAGWLGWLPGGLMHSNIGACALFAATSGSSVATAATVGAVALPQAKKRGYNERLFLGTLAAGGTLGILIPPSINLILYGLLTDTSVPELYLAGFLPGLLLAGLFMLAVVVACVARPDWRGRPVSVSWKQRLAGLSGLVPPLGVFLIVVGSIYAGVATPTEAASLGVVSALALAAWNRKLGMGMLLRAVESAMRTTASIMLIILAAVFLNFVLSALGLTQALTAAIVGLDFGPTGTLLLIIAFYLALGCFMETVSMLLTTAALVTPIVVALGYDPVWFGILLMVLLETALITPPVGINLYVVQGVRGRGPIADVMLGSLPFACALFVMIAVLVLFPGVALWLPNLFY